MKLTIGIPASSILLHYSDKGMSSAIRKVCAWERGTKYEETPNHASIYVGGGEGKLIEAVMPFVREYLLMKYIDSGDRIEVIVYDITQTQVEIVKSFCYGALGKVYDITGMWAFVVRILPQWLVRMLPVIRKITPKEWANFCSELDVESYEQAHIKISNYPASETMPVDIRLYAVEHNARIFTITKNQIIERIEGGVLKFHINRSMHVAF